MVAVLGSRFTGFTVPVLQWHSRWSTGPWVLAPPSPRSSARGRSLFCTTGHHPDVPRRETSPPTRTMRLALNIPVCRIVSSTHEAGVTGRGRVPLPRGRGVALVSGRCVAGPSLLVRLLRSTLGDAFHLLGSHPIRDVEKTSGGKAVRSIWRAPQCQTSKELLVKKHLVHSAVV